MMYLLYCDESNLEARAGSFFVYGGIAVDSAAVLGLSRAIDEIRAKCGIPAMTKLKFNPRPEELSHEQFIAVKTAVVQAAVDHGCVLLVSLILHDIATTPDDARKLEINRVCYHFDCFLNRKDCAGLVLIDRFTDATIDHHLREKFSVGLTGMPYSKVMRLKHIIGFHYSAIGQSHMCSVIDIVLGSMRYAVNACASAEQKMLPSSREMLCNLSPLLFREEGKDTVSEIGLFLSPKTVRKDAFRAKYVELKSFLGESGIALEQEIVAERRY